MVGAMWILLSVHNSQYIGTFFKVLKVIVIFNTYSKAYCCVSYVKWEHGFFSLTDGRYYTEPGELVKHPGFQIYFGTLLLSWNG